MAQGSREIRNITKEYPHKTQIIKYKQPYQMPVSNGGSRMKISPTDAIVVRAKQAIQDFKDDRAERRAKTNIRDIALCNDFDMFCTFTFDKKHVDRQDPTMCKLKMQRFFINMRDKYGTFRYLIIPEFHSDGQSLHFHALFGGYPGKLVESPNSYGDKPLYNLPDYKYGFADARMISPTLEDKEKVASYVTKYITKDMPTFSGKKRYWCSRDLIRPIKKINDVRFDDLSKTRTGYIVRRKIIVLMLV